MGELRGVDFNTLFEVANYNKYDDTITILAGKLTERFHGQHNISFWLYDKHGGRNIVEKTYYVDCPWNNYTDPGPDPYLPLTDDNYVFPRVAKTNQLGQAWIRFSQEVIPPWNFTNITNGSVYINETWYPAIDVRVHSSDLDLTSQKDLSFTWEVMNFTKEFMLVQLYFKYPERVSLSIPYDYVTVTFWD